VSLLETPSSYLQIAIASLVFSLVGLTAGVFLLMISGLIDMSQLPNAAAGFGIVPLTIGFGFFALLLLWWRNTLGYISGIVAGILFLVNGIFSTSDAFTVDVMPVGMAILGIPMVIFSLILIATSYLAWRE
jgi:hypothetical protein